MEKDRGKVKNFVNHFNGFLMVAGLFLTAQSLNVMLDT